MIVNVDIPREIEARLLADAQDCGVSLSDLVRNFMIEHYEEEKDLRLAEDRLKNPLPPISSSQLRKNLGLEPHCDG